MQRALFPQVSRLVNRPGFAWKTFLMLWLCKFGAVNSEPVQDARSSTSKEANKFSSPAFRQQYLAFANPVQPLLFAVIAQICTAIHMNVCRVRARVSERSRQTVTWLWLFAMQKYFSNNHIIDFNYPQMDPSNELQPLNKLRR